MIPTCVFCRRSVLTAGALQLRPELRFKQVLTESRVSVSFSGKFSGGRIPRAGRLTNALWMGEQTVGFKKAVSYIATAQTLLISC